MAIDLHTLQLVNAILPLTLTMITSPFAWWKKGCEDFQVVSVAYLFFGLAFFLQFAPLKPAGILVTSLGHGLIALGLYLLYEGIHILRQRRRQYAWLNPLLLLLVISSSLYGSVSGANTPLSNGVVQLFYIVQCSACIWALHHEPPATEKLWLQIASFSFFILILGLTINTLSPFFIAEPEVGANTNAIQAAPGLAFTFFFVASGLSLLMGSEENCEHELQTLADNLHNILDERSASNVVLHKNNRFLDTLLDTIPTPIFYKDQQGIYKKVNLAFCNALGLTRETLINRRAITTQSGGADLVDQDREADNRLLATGKMQRYESSILFGDGLHHQVLVSKDALLDSNGEILGIVGSITDITERKIREAKIRYLAHHDSLTGLFNRNYFFKQLQKSISRAGRSGTIVTLLFIDLDGFKTINDTFGHPAGDLTLKTIGARLLDITRDYDTVCRLGGDEFAFILEDVEDRKDVIKVAEKILHSITEPIKYEGQDCSVSASIGLASYPEHTAIPDELVKLADKAMYAAKSRGKNQFCFYPPPEPGTSDGG